MAQVEKHITLEEFIGNVESFLEWISREQMPVYIENKAGEQFLVKPVSSRKVRGKRITEEDYKAFLSSAGGWKDVDTEKLKKDISEARKLSGPPIEL